MTTTTRPRTEHVEAWESDYRWDVETILKPRPRLTVSQWAPSFRQLGGGSAEKGPWNNARVPYLVEPMDAVSDPAVERVVVIKPARVGYSEACILNGTGYFMHQDPSPIIIALPTIDDAEKFSKTKLVPAIEATDVLRKLIPEVRSRDGTNTILYKEFPGGDIQLVGTNSPRQLRMRDARVVFLDEVDAMPASSGDEGDTYALLVKRADNWPNRKIVAGSSPKWKGTSRIERLYQDSQRRKYWMPCPHCGTLQVLMFGGKDTGYGLKWVNRRPETAVYICVKGCTIEERYKTSMHEGARWVPEDPDHAVWGYWFNALISLFPGVKWPRLVSQWLGAQEDSESLQVFVNTVLAETYELRGEKVESTGLMGRREVYPAEVPAGVGVLTAFVDVQRGSGGWLEVLVRGWGAEQESWRIAHHRIEGAIDDREVHDQLDAILFRTYKHESGAELRIRRAFIDSGDQAAAVYQYVKKRQSRGVFASKGDKGQADVPIVIRGKKPNDAGIKLMTIGTFTAKRRLFSRLKLSRPGPGYLHYNKLPESVDVADQAAFDAQDAEFFRQFEAEKLMKEKDARGREVTRYVQVAERNESIDLEVGCLAALHGLGPSVYDHLSREVRRVEARAVQGDTGDGGPREERLEADDVSVESARPRRGRGRSNTYVYGYRR